MINLILSFGGWMRGIDIWTPGRALIAIVLLFCFWLVLTAIGDGGYPA